MFFHMQLTVSVSLALHLQSAHVSYAGDCLITPALYAVAPSHARDRWELRDPCLANETV